MVTKPNLIRLNALLSELDLPDFRKKVDDSGSNLGWLRKNAWRRNELSVELIELMNLPDVILLGDELADVAAQ